MIEKNEELFRNLHLMHNVDSQYTKDLINEGWINRSYGNTSKAFEFIKSFYDSKKSLVLELIKKYGSLRDNIHKIKDGTDIEDYFTIETIAMYLCEEGYLSEIKGEDYISK